MAEKTNIKIAIAVDTILYFPFYLLQEDGKTYGLDENLSLSLQSFNGDSDAYEAFNTNEDYDFFLGDPIMGADDIANDNSLVFPLIRATGLWMLSENKMKIKYYSDFDNKGIYRVYAASTGYTSNRIFKYIKRQEHSDFKMLFNDASNTKEFKYGDVYSNIAEHQLAISSNLLSIKYIQHLCPYIQAQYLPEIDDNTLKENIFTGLISKASTSPEIIQKLINALSHILSLFGDETQREKMANLLYQSKSIEADDAEERFYGSLSYKIEMSFKGNLGKSIEYNLKEIFPFLTQNNLDAIDKTILNTLVSDFDLSTLKEILITPLCKSLRPNASELKNIYINTLDELYKSNLYPKDMRYIAHNLGKLWKNSERLNYLNYESKKDNPNYQKRIAIFMDNQYLNQLSEEKLYSRKRRTLTMETSQETYGKLT